MINPALKPDRADYPIEIKSEDGLVLVELEYLDEGNSGDYDETDPDDVPLVRFSLYRLYVDGVDNDKFADVCDTCDYDPFEWGAVRDGSYCTSIDARSSKEDLEKHGKEILAHVYDGLKNLTREKRLYEKLSWIG